MRVAGSPALVGARVPRHCCGSPRSPVASRIGVSVSTAIRTLRGRSPAELGERLRQVASAWLERAGWRDSGEVSLAKLRERFPCPPLCEKGPGERRTVVRGPFFAGLDNRESTLAVLRATAPDHEAALRARADAALEGRFDLLGHRNVF